MGKDHLDNTGVDWRIILKWIIKVVRVCGLETLQ